MLGAAAAQDAKDAKEDTVRVHGKSLALSCAEWKRNQDGSWTSTGPLLVGTETVNERDLARRQGNERLGNKVRERGQPSR